MRSQVACDGLCGEGRYWLSDALLAVTQMLEAGVVVDKSDSSGASRAVAKYVAYTGNYGPWEIGLVHSLYVTAARGSEANALLNGVRPAGDSRQMPCCGCWFHAVGRSPCSLQDIEARLERHIELVFA